MRIIILSNNELLPIVFTAFKRCAMVSTGHSYQSATFVWSLAVCLLMVGVVTAVTVSKDVATGIICFNMFS